jgi:membrane-associated phospholipid phosphatase
MDDSAESSRRARRILLATAVSWVLLAVVSGVWDLTISRAVVNAESGWGRFGARWGELPGFLVSALAVSVVLGNLLASVKKGPRTVDRVFRRVGGGIVLALLALFGWYRSFDLIVHGYAGDRTIVVLAAALLAGVAAVLATSRLPRPIRACIVGPAAVVAILAVANPILFVQLCKTLWGRVRFRDLAPDFSNFTPWFLPQGVTGHRSFPSGHTAMGWMLLPLAFAGDRLSLRNAAGRRTLRERFRRGGTWTVVIGWGVFVAASRVVVGAHYLSDVVFSTGAAFAVTVPLCRRFCEHPVARTSALR